MAQSSEGGTVFNTNIPKKLIITAPSSCSDSKQKVSELPLGIQNYLRISLRGSVLFINLPEPHKTHPPLFIPPSITWRRTDSVNASFLPTASTRCCRLCCSAAHQSGAGEEQRREANSSGEEEEEEGGRSRYPPTGGTTLCSIPWLQNVSGEWETHWDYCAHCLAPALLLWDRRRRWAALCAPDERWRKILWCLLKET